MKTSYSSRRYSSKLAWWSKWFYIFNGVAYARLSPQGNRPIDRMTNVPGSRWLLPGLINQTIFPVSTFTETSRFLRAILKSILVEARWLKCFFPFLDYSETFECTFGFLHLRLPFTISILIFNLRSCEFYSFLFIKSLKFLMFH